jgi:tetratricopeptide (TPR) repeat protein
VIDAEGLLRRAAAGSPESAAWQLDHGRALLRLERHDEALTALRRAVELDPQLARARGWVGIALARTGRTDEARRDLEQALRAAPGNPEPHLGLGDLAVASEQWRVAVAHYRQAAQEAVMAAEACRKIGEVALRLGETRDALEWFGQSLQRNPHDPLAHWGYSRALQAAGRAEDAAAESEIAMRLAAEQAAAGSHVKLPQ